MSDQRDELRRALTRFMDRRSSVSVIQAKVVAVDLADYTCTVEDRDGLELFDVALSPTDDPKFILVPKVGTQVLVANIGNSDAAWSVIQCDELSSAKLTVGTTVFELTNAGVNITRGTESLQGVLGDLITQIKAITVNVTAVGAPSGIPLNSLAFDAIATRLNTILDA